MSEVYELIIIEIKILKYLPELDFDSVDIINISTRKC